MYSEEQKALLREAFIASHPRYKEYSLSKIRGLIRKEKQAKKRMKYLDTLLSLYVDRNLSLRQLAKKYHISRQAISKPLNEFRNELLKHTDYEKHS